MENWKEDFEVLFGDVERKDYIRVFIQDLLEQELDKARVEAKREVAEELRIKLKSHENDWDIRDMDDLVIQIQFDLDCILGHEKGKEINDIEEIVQQIRLVIRDKYLKSEKEDK